MVFPLRLEGFSIFVKASDAESVHFRSPRLNADELRNDDAARKPQRLELAVLFSDFGEPPSLS